jgi:mannose-6-phosphate isomerase
MGTYPKLPSYVLSTGQDLQTLLSEHSAELIGRKVLEKFGHSQLPFLPKVLSFDKALPLQIHPDKGLAAKLQKQAPSDFTDANHKPEIAIALSKFEAFCGFKPLKAIEYLMQLDPLKKYMRSSAKAQLDNEELMNIVRAMLTAEEDSIATTTEQLQKLEKSAFGADTYIADLIPRLENDFGKTDPGLLVALVTMNYMVLQPGDAIYIPADGIHAYLTGDIIECMARSDNVLNTGFCPAAGRHSADVFCDALTFSPHSVQESMLQSQAYSGSGHGKTKVYKPPMSEFNMLATELSAGQKETLAAVEGPSIAVVTNGQGTLKAKDKSWELGEGSVFFIAQGVELELQSGEGLSIYIAFVE